MTFEIFISYSTRNAASANALVSRLERAGFNIWQDVKRLSLGGQWTLELDQALRRSQALILLLTTEAYHSSFVQKEALAAQDLNIPIIPVMLEEDTPRWVFIYNIQYLSYYGDDSERETAFQKLVARLESLRDNPSQPDVILEPNPQRDSVNVARHTDDGVYEDEAEEDDINPFWYGSSLPDGYFVGRTEELRIIKNAIGTSNKMSCLSFIGNRRVGKTSLLKYVYENYRTLIPKRLLREHDYVVIYLNMMDGRARTTASMMRAIRKGIHKQAGIMPWTAEEDGDYYVLSEALVDLADDGKRLVFCFDEWETVMARPELTHFLEEMRTKGDDGVISMLIATAYTLQHMVNVGEIGSPFYNIFQQHYLGLLPESEWQALVERGLGDVVTMAEAAKIITMTESLTGGHAYMVQLFGSLLWQMKHDTGRIDFNLVREAYITHPDTNALLAWLYHHLSQEQVMLLHQILDDKALPPQYRNTLSEMRGRGIIRADDTLFADTFRDYVLAQRGKT